MREIIRAELDRIHPTDDARRALELIIESSVRPSEVDGALKLTDHRPRRQAAHEATWTGEDVEFTLHDLLDELRVRYPVLFRPAKRDADQAGADGHDRNRARSRSATGSLSIPARRRSAAADSGTRASLLPFITVPDGGPRTRVRISTTPSAASEAPGASAEAPRTRCRRKPFRSWPSTERQPFSAT